MKDFEATSDGCCDGQATAEERLGSDDEGAGMDGVSIAGTIWSRFRGLLGCSDASGILMLTPCGSIHTFGMRFPIDVAFVGADGTVLESHCAVPPRRRLRCRGAVATLERRSGVDGDWLECGDRLRLAVE